MILTCDYCSSRYILPDAGLVNCLACGAPGPDDVEKPRADIEWRRLAAYDTLRIGRASFTDSDGGISEEYLSTGG